MAARYVIVDGSNLATEGRSIPSLAQLDEAVRAFMAERPTDQVIVVVDASFGYRIDESERREYEQAEAAGEIVSPPAGAVGRGDGFLLRIADRTDAAVLSNDSFQEFHADYPWLFDEGRLMGGKPVPGVGWIFTPRSPVRGPRSREVMRNQKKAQKAAMKRAVVAEGPLAEAIATATAEAISPEQAAAEPPPDAEAGTAPETARGAKRVRRRRAKPVGSVNDPLPFIQFIADHPLGSEVEGTIEDFTSHGAFVRAGGARCYVPLVALGDPPPRSAKSVLKRGESRSFVVQALDPPRRGIELALPELARVAGTPTDETVEADIGAGRKGRAAARSKAEAKPGEAAAAEAAAEVGAEAGAAPAPVPAKRSRRAPKKAAVVAAEVAAEPEPAVEAAPAPPAKARRSRKATATATAEAPAKPRRSRKATAAPIADATVEAPIPAQPEPAPAAKPRRSRKAPALEPEAVPAPAKSRRSRKATAPAPEPEPEPELEPAPAAKPRRSPKAAAALATAAPMPAAGAAAEPQSPAKKATRRKAVAKVAAEPTSHAPAADVAADVATPRTRRRSRSSG